MAFTDLTLDPWFRKKFFAYVGETCDNSVRQNEIREVL